MQARRQTTLFGGSMACNCGFHVVKPANAPQSLASVSAPGATASAQRTFLFPLSLSMLSLYILCEDLHACSILCQFSLYILCEDLHACSILCEHCCKHHPGSRLCEYCVYSFNESGGGEPATAAAASFWLPQEMSKTIPVQDQRWIANTLFHSGKLRPDLKLWYEPPVSALIYHHQTPMPDRFFTHRLMVWMPYHLWKVRVFCPACRKQLTGAGVHRRVLDIDRYYLMVTETLSCSVCVVNFLSTSQTVRDQLDLPHQKMFQLILTQKYACDIRVIRLLRERTLGNSPARLVKQLKENHGEEWLNRLAHYLWECADFVARPSLFPVVCQELPEPIDIPSSRWVLSVYGRDILSRMDHIKASITSTFGSILKMDSTKKIRKKLAGHAKGTALWVTSIGNEVGQIVTSVLTVQEGPGLDTMASGVMERYRQAAVPPPVLLYVDCGCCVSDGTSMLHSRFSDWPDLHIRLDIWHFMRRLAVGCTTDAHPLYPTFMGCLSACIFEWDARDLTLLRQAKRALLVQEGVPGLTDQMVDGKISKNELSLYCRRRTCGEVATITLHHQFWKR
ncbi:hypothetical protein NQZ68_009904 [Dissostichus eleginoides]|nr:hypothetical protein NQZ68_009904 [Dissostichus eleginoides]